MAEEKAKKNGIRPRIPSEVYKILLDGASKAGLPVKFWLYQAIQEKVERQEQESSALIGESE